MRLWKVILSLVFVLLLTGGLWQVKDYLVQAQNDQLVFLNIDPIYEAMMKRDILCLMMAYPEYILDVERGEDGTVYVIMKSGKKLLYDDGKTKNQAQKSSIPDLQDMMEQLYPIGKITELLPAHYNPGCVRHYPLLKEVYGANKTQIQSNLVKVSIGYKFVEFNRNNQAAQALNSVMKELLPLARQKYKIYGAAFPSSGTFNYRLIGSTSRLSSHAFGMAIDLNAHKNDYWKWNTRDDGQKRLDSYPQEIVHIFEKYGFVWGGKWGNFDIMHYEYRPEIILKARYLSEKPISGLPWYDGLQNNQEAWRFIWLIEQTI